MLKMGGGRRYKVVRGQMKNVKKILFLFYVVYSLYINDLIGHAV